MDEPNFMKKFIIISSDFLTHSSIVGYVDPFIHSRCLGVLRWDDIYLKSCMGRPIYLARRVACGSTHVSKVVRVDLAGQIGVVHVDPHVPKVVGVGICGSTCPKGAKDRPSERNRSVFMWVHILIGVYLDG
jgi:hypothetical protein